MQTNVKKGSRVRLTVEKNRLVLEPVEKDIITLKSLLAGVTPENIHQETNWGKSMGKEISWDGPAMIRRSGLHIHLNLGKAGAVMYAADLT